MEIIRNTHTLMTSKMILDVLPAVSLPALSLKFLEVGQEVASFIAAVVGVAYAVIRFYYFIKDRRKLKRDNKKTV